MNIIKDLEANGWDILKVENQMIFAERSLTKKHAFFISEGTKIDEAEIARVWTKKEFHPFVYRETSKGIIYYDFLFDEVVKRP